MSRVMGIRGLKNFIFEEKLKDLGNWLKNVEVESSRGSYHKKVAK